MGESFLGHRWGARSGASPWCQVRDSSVLGDPTAAPHDLSPARRTVTGMRRVLLGFSLLLAAVISLVVATFGLPSSGDPVAAHARVIGACSDYACVRTALRSALDDLGPRGALEAYAATKPTSGFGIDCHGAAHELGEWAWADYGRAAWFAFDTNVCNYGYYHGAMVEIARSLSLGEFIAIAHELCETDPLPVKVLPGRECAHGFGHAVIHLTDSVAAAVEKCNAFPGERFRRRCNEGIAKDLLRYETVVNTADFDRCADWPASDRGVCFYITGAYAVVHAPVEGLALVAEFCIATTDDGLRGECLAGLGRGIAMKSVGEDQRHPGEWAKIVCRGFTECAADFGRSVFYVCNDVAWSTAECGRLGGALAEACAAGVRRADADDGDSLSTSGF